MESTWFVVNGSTVQKYSNKKVSIVGVILKVYPNRLLMDVRTTDDMTVKIILNKPLDITNINFIEIHGISAGAAIKCTEIIEFPDDEIEDFDVGSYNDLCSLLQDIGNDLYQTS